MYRLPLAYSRSYLPCPKGLGSTVGGGRPAERQAGLHTRADRQSADQDPHGLGGVAQSRTTRSRTITYGSSLRCPGLSSSRASSAVSESNAPRCARPRNLFLIPWLTFVKARVATADINLATSANEIIFRPMPATDQPRGRDILVHLKRRHADRSPSVFRTSCTRSVTSSSTRSEQLQLRAGVTLTYEAHAIFPDTPQYTIMSYFASSSNGAVRSRRGDAEAHVARWRRYGFNIPADRDTVWLNSMRGATTIPQNIAPVIAICYAGGRDRSILRLERRSGSTSSQAPEHAAATTFSTSSIARCRMRRRRRRYAISSIARIMAQAAWATTANGFWQRPRAGGSRARFSCSPRRDSFDYLRLSDGTKWTADCFRFSRESTR